mgnify:CR=1 FL=1
MAKKKLPGREDILERMWKLANARVEDAVRLACWPEEEPGRLEKLELDGLTDAVIETMDKTMACYETRQRYLAIQVEPLEEVVDLIADDLKNRHVERLKDGECTIELGTQFLELLINLERISDHCSNVALRIVRQTASKDDIVRIDSHAYMRELHHGSDREFDQLFQQYRDKYYVPIEEETR